MTTSAYKPRHAAPDTTPGAPAVVEDPATQILPVIPVQRGLGVTTTHAVGAVVPSGRPPYNVATPPLPPAGLRPHHPPIPRGGRFRIVLAVAVAVAVLIGLAAAVGTSMTSPATNGQDAAANEPQASALSPQQQLARWNLGGGSSRNQAIVSDLSAVSDTGRRLDTAGMNAACRSLRNSIEAAQAYDPIPDARAQASWSSALAHGARSATFCVAGTDSMSASLIRSATSEINDMTTDLNRTTDRINVINGGV